MSEDSVPGAPMNTADRIANFISELESESDRGSILICAIYCENALKRILTAGSLGEDYVKNIINRASGLNSWREVAYSFGLISEKESDAIKLIGEIRNKIAHDGVVDGKPFSSVNVREKVTKMPFIPDSIKSSMVNGTTQEKIFKYAFVLSSAETVLKLERRAESVKRPQVPSETEQLSDQIFNILRNREFWESVLPGIIEILQAIPSESQCKDEPFEDLSTVSNYLFFCSDRRGLRRVGHDGGRRKPAGWFVCGRWRMALLRGKVAGEVRRAA